MIFQFMTPLIFLICASGFWLIWFNYRHMKAAGLWALSYTFAALGFLANLTHDAMTELVRRVTPGFARTWIDPGTPVSYAVMIMFLAAMWLFVGAAARRYGRPVPTTTMAIITGVLGGLVTWNWFIDPHPGLRTLMVCLSCALILGLTLLMVPRTARAIDHAIFALTALAVALFVALPFAMPALFGASFAAGLEGTTALGAALQFCVSATALIMGLVLFVALGLDIIEELQHRSDTDALTGLRNRLAFEIAARRAIAECERRGGPGHEGGALCLVVADIDHFKSVNDNWGHAFGDRAIKLFGLVLRSAARQADVAGRVGGEEFCLLLPTATARIGLRVAERARGTFALAGHELVDGRRPLTASFGVAEWREDESYEDLFTRADDALYRAKKTGRNRVCVAGESEPRAADSQRGTRTAAARSRSLEAADAA